MNAKLTADDVREVRALRARGEKLAWIAAKFGVSVTCIFFICNRTTWRSLDDATGGSRG